MGVLPKAAWGELTALFSDNEGGEQVFEEAGLELGFSCEKNEDSGSLLLTVGSRQDVPG